VRLFYVSNDNCVTVDFGTIQVYILGWFSHITMTSMIAIRQLTERLCRRCVPLTGYASLGQQYGGSLPILIVDSHASDEWKRDRGY
jgi:hypothetical protein